MSENVDRTGGAAHTIENNSDSSLQKEQDAMNTARNEMIKDSNLNMLMGVHLVLTVELGRASLPVKAVLELQKGTVIELDKIAGESVDIYVNESMIGHGDVVVVDDKFGVRVTELVAIEKRF